MAEASVDVGLVVRTLSCVGFAVFEGRFKHPTIFLRREGIGRGERGWEFLVVCLCMSFLTAPFKETCLEHVVEDYLAEPIIGGVIETVGGGEGVSGSEGVAEEREGSVGCGGLFEGEEHALESGGVL